MITFKEAFNIVIDEFEKLNSNSRMVRVITKIQHTNVGWVFFWDNEKYLLSKNIEYAIAGNLPVFVDKEGAIHTIRLQSITPESIEDWIEENIS